MCAVALSIGSCRKDEPERFSAEEIENYNPYSFGDEFTGLKEWHGACAGVRNGDFVGRNFDWECSETPEFIVRIPADENHRASIGICNSNMVKHAPTEGWLSQLLVNDI